jgi:DNA replication protein DnaC
MKTPEIEQRIRELLKELHLPGMREFFAEKAQKALVEGLSHQEYLAELLEHERSLRRHNSIARRLHESGLPMEKTFDTLDQGRLSPKTRHQIKVLREGVFVDNCENVLVFGKPGTGKSHILCALGHALVEAGRRVYFGRCGMLVQELLRVKGAHQLDRHIKKLGRFDALILDDIGYVQQSREEMEVLFTLLAALYERGSVMITSNLPFSKWEAIFKDPMTTAAAIDRLVHHSVIMELNIPSYRMEQARKRAKTGGLDD